MIAVIFEVWPDPKKGRKYFDLAAALRKDVEQADGFVSVERFESLTDKGKYLSLSTGATAPRSRSGTATPSTARRKPPAAKACSATTASGSPRCFAIMA